MSKRGRCISLQEARQIALQTLADTEQRLTQERAAEAETVASEEDANGEDMKKKATGVMMKEIANFGITSTRASQQLDALGLEGTQRQLAMLGAFVTRIRDERAHTGREHWKIDSCLKCAAAMVLERAGYGDVPGS